MIPILYEVGTSEFSKNGIGRLINAVSCSVTEGRNGEFELTLRYRVGGQYYNELAIDRVIAAIPYEGGTKQGFDIYNIVNNLDGTIEVMARHISYRANFIPVRPFSAHGITQTISRLYENCLEPNPFTIYTDITNEQTDYYEHTVPRSLRACLGGNEGSFLDIWTSRGYGEYLWDNLTINFLKKRGVDRGYTIRYAKNLVDLSQEFDAEEHVTGVLPYWVSTSEYSEGSDETDIPLTIWGDVQHADNIAAPYFKTIAVDFSEKFPEQPTKAQLNALAKAYANESSILTDSLDVDFYDENDQNIHLCDTVKVIFTQLGIERKFQVIKTKWDVLLERYSSITLGANKSDLASTLIGYNSDTLSKISNSNNKMISVIQHVDYEIGEISDRISEIDTRIEQGVTGVVAYYLANDGTTPSKTDTRWSTAFPSDISGKTVWVLYETSYIDETSERSNPVKYGGEGKYVTAAKTQYYVSNSSSTQSGGSWTDGAMPSVPNGKFLWTRQVLTYSDSSTENTTPTLILSDLYSITTTQQTAIDQNTAAIALRATKTEVTSAINQEVSDRNSAISSAINTEVTNRNEAIDAAVGVNLSPYFANEYDDIYNLSTNPTGYWQTRPSASSIGESNRRNGWASVTCDNTNGSDYIWPVFYPHIGQHIAIEDEHLTMLVEIKASTVIGDCYMWNSSALNNITPRYTSSALHDLSNGKHYITLNRTDESDPNVFTRSGFGVPAGGKLMCLVRISVYKEGYSGDFVPYTSDRDFLSSKYATSAELTVAADEITSRVSSTESKVYSLENDVSDVDGKIAKAKQEAITFSETKIEQTDSTIRADVTKAYETYADNAVGTFREEVTTYMSFSSDGLELGKSNSDFKAKLSNDELAFMQGNDKVAYISSNKLYITQAEITNNLKLGKYEWTQEEDGRISLRWRG